MNRLEVPREHYEGVGKVAVAAAHLEGMLARVVVAAQLGKEGQDWLDATATRPLEVLMKGKSKFSAGHPVRDLCRDAKRALDDRNRMVHSLAYFDGAPESGEQPGWVLVHPKSGDDIPMPTAAEFAELWARLNALSARCLYLERNLLADSVRTVEG